LDEVFIATDMMYTC